MLVDIIFIYWGYILSRYKMFKWFFSLPHRKRILIKQETRTLDDFFKDEEFERWLYLEDILEASKGDSQKDWFYYFIIGHKSISDKTTDGVRYIKYTKNKVFKTLDFDNYNIDLDKDGKIIGLEFFKKI